MEDNIPGPKDEAVVISRQKQSTSAEALENMAERLVTADSILQIGSMEGNIEKMIGQIEDVEVGRNDEVLVLDAKNKDIRIYDNRGQFVRSLGQPGEGPGEFLEPEELELDRNGRLMVADRDGRMAIFSDTALVEEISSSFIAEHFCPGDSTLFATGRSEASGLIHQVTLSGEVVRSIGKRYQAGNQMINAAISHGPLVCSPDQQRLVFAFSTAPYIYGYSPTGEIDWMIKIADFQPMEIEEFLTDDGRRGTRYSYSDSHLVLRMTRLPGEYTLAQVAWRTSESMKMDKLYAELHSYLLDMGTGRGRYIGKELPLVYDATDTRLYTGTNHPYPQVFVYTY